MRYKRVLLLALVSLGGGLLVAHAQTSQEVRVRWDVAEPSTRRATPAHVFTVTARQHSAEAMPRQRSPELSEDQIFIAAVDAQGRQRSWALIPDPSILRAEGPGPTGELSGQVLSRATAEFVVTLPADPAVSELRFYRPRWTGEGFTLDLLGMVPLQ